MRCYSLRYDILTVLQDSFIHEENNDIFNDTNNAVVVDQNHCLVHNALNDTVESLRSTVSSPSSSSPFVLYGRVNVTALIICDEQVANTPCWVEAPLARIPLAILVMSAIPIDS